MTPVLRLILEVSFEVILRVIWYAIWTIILDVMLATVFEGFRTEADYGFEGNFDDNQGEWV